MSKAKEKRKGAQKSILPVKVQAQHRVNPPEPGSYKSVLVGGAVSCSCLYLVHIKRKRKQKGDSKV
jgi:hypothetical protein